MRPSKDYLSCDIKAFSIGESYWNYVLAHLLDEGYVEGFFTVLILRGERGIKGMVEYPDYTKRHRIFTGQFKDEEGRSVSERIKGNHPRNIKVLSKDYQ